MSAYTEFFLSSGRNVAMLELLEISHPNFSQTYYITRSQIGGVTVIHEDSTTHDYTYVPCEITRDKVSDDMDSSVKIQLGDLGDILSVETDNVRIANGFSIKPTVRFRIYREDVLSMPIDGPFIYELSNFAFNNQGTIFDAAAPSLNSTGTGETYKVGRFSMLRAFL